MLGTALLIWTGRDQTTLAARGLALRLPVFIGLISYSLYLWHWPLIVFAQYWLVRDLNVPEALGVALAAVVLATCSWRFIEQPFRRVEVPIRLVVSVSVAGSLLLAVLAPLLIVSGGLP